VILGDAIGSFFRFFYFEAFDCRHFRLRQSSQAKHMSQLFNSSHWSPLGQLTSNCEPFFPRKILLFLHFAGCCFTSACRFEYFFRDLLHSPFFFSIRGIYPSFPLALRFFCRGPDLIFDFKSKLDPRIFRARFFGTSF